MEKTNHVKSIGNYIWIYAKDKETLDRNYYSSKDVCVPKTVGQFDQNLKLIRIWNSAYEVEKELNISAGELALFVIIKEIHLMDIFGLIQTEMDIL